MAEAFRGEFFSKIDSKARVQIPASFRRILGEEDPSANGRTRLVVVYGVKSRQHCECYSVSGAESLAATLDLYPLGSDERRYLERELITRSVTIEMDDDGRCVLPAQVREKLGIDGEVHIELALAGVKDSFTLWRKDVYAQTQGEDDPFDGIDPKTLIGRAQKAAT